MRLKDVRFAVHGQTVGLSTILRLITGVLTSKRAK